LEERYLWFRVLERDANTGNQSGGLKKTSGKIEGEKKELFPDGLRKANKGGKNWHPGAATGESF